MLEETEQQGQRSSGGLFSRIMMLIMICSFILSGCGSSPQKDTPLITAGTSSSSQQSPIASATSTGKSTVSIKVIDAQTSLSSYPGGYMTMSISTGPAAICTITVYYGLNTPSKSFGIIPVTSDRNGIASWHWKVPSSAPVGFWPLTISAVQVNGTKITTQVNVTVL